MPTYPVVQQTFGAMRPVARGPNVEAQIEDDARAILAMQQQQAEREARRKDAEAQRTAMAAYRGTNVALRTTSVQNAKAYQDAILRQREDALKAMAPTREANLAKTKLETSRMQDEDARRIAATKRIRFADALEADPVAAADYAEELAAIQQKQPNLLQMTPEQKKVQADNWRRQAQSIFPKEALTAQHQEAMQARREAAAKAEEDRKTAAKVTPLQEKAKVIAALRPISSFLRLQPKTEEGTGKVIAGTSVSAANMAALVQAMREGASLPEAADVAAIDLQPSAELAQAEQALKAAQDTGWYTSASEKEAITQAENNLEAAKQKHLGDLDSFVWDEASGRIVDKRKIPASQAHLVRALTPAPDGGIPSGVSSTVRDVVGSRTAMKQEAARKPTIDEEYHYFSQALKNNINPKTGQPLNDGEIVRIKAAMAEMKRRMIPQGK